MSGSLVEYGLALTVFLATHMVPAMAGVRGRLIESLGRRTYIFIYSIISVAALAWLVSAALRAPYVHLWPFWPWMTYVPALVMPVATVLLVTGLAAPNPLSVTMSGRGFDPDRPGIVAITRHPVLWAFALWAGSHILPNGDAARASLFLLLLTFALIGMPLSDARARRRLGEDRWRDLSRQTSTLPFAAILAGRARLRLNGIDWEWVVLGLAVYAGLALLHRPVIGVSSFPI